MQEFFCIHWLKCGILSSQVMWIWWNYAWKSMGTNGWLLPKGLYAYIQTSVHLLHCLHTVLHIPAWQTHFHAPNLLPVWSLCTNYNLVLLKTLIFLVHINFEYLKWSQTVLIHQYRLCLPALHCVSKYAPHLTFTQLFRLFIFSYESWLLCCQCFLDVYLNCIIQGRALR